MGEICDTTQGVNHIWKVILYEDEAVKDKYSSTMHRVRCSRCYEVKREGHEFENDGCLFRCVKCGYEEIRHKFQDGACKNCGCSESVYYSDRIASGKVGYYDIESQKGQIYIRYCDHVTDVDDLIKIAIALATNNSASNPVPKGIFRKIKEISGSVKEADEALAEIALSDKVHIYWRRYACEEMSDKQKRKDISEYIIKE